MSTREILVDTNGPQNPTRESHRKWENERNSLEAALAEGFAPAGGDGTASMAPADYAGWLHPGTVPHPRSVLISALGPSRIDYVSAQTAHEPPVPLMSIDEVWGINTAVNWQSGRVSYDLLWVMDHLDGEAAKHPRYGKQISDWIARHDRNVMTSIAGELGASVDGSSRNESRVHEFPLAQVWQSLTEVAPGLHPYFHNSLPYLLAYAWWIGVQDVYLFGVDYNHPTIGNKYEAQRPNCEFWVGWLMARGVRVMLPNSSTLINADQPIWFYGYPQDADRAVRYDGSAIDTGRPS